MLEFIRKCKEKRYEEDMKMVGDFCRHMWGDYKLAENSVRPAKLAENSVRPKFIELAEKNDKEGINT